MREVTCQQVIDCLNSLGIIQGDGLLVHSAVQFLGRPIGGLAMYLEAIQTVIGPQGTLAVPTFNFAFAQGEPYDPQQTPSKNMGAFSEYVRQQPGVQRTPHPMQSLAVMGRYADDLARRDTLSAFDPGSAFERMLELDFKLLLMGAGSAAISMFHYCEQRAQVPYRYWKNFSGQVRTPSGWQQRTYRLFVRYLELDPQMTSEPVERLLCERGQWMSIPLNYGQISLCRMPDFVAAGDDAIVANPWCLVTNRPR